MYSHGSDHFTPIQAAARDQSRFVFLHVSSGMARKGIEELFAAYASAFKQGDAVELIIKTHSNANNVVMKLYNEFISEKPLAPAVTLIFEDISEPAMARLYSLADALVLPSRGEGFNLPALEAMRSGRPVIVTAHSGQMDFCTSETAWLVDFDFERARSHLAGSGSMWAVAHTHGLARQMRRIVAECLSGDILRDVSGL